MVLTIVRIRKKRLPFSLLTLHLHKNGAKRITGISTNKIFLTGLKERAGFAWMHEGTFTTLMKLARLRLMLRASSGISVWRMVMWGMMDNTSDCSVWWKLSGKRWARGICSDIGTNLWWLTEVELRASQKIKCHESRYKMITTGQINLEVNIFVCADDLKLGAGIKAVQPPCLAWRLFQFKNV